MDCGILHNGFARVKCKDCNYEYLLAFSCKRRHSCPSCHAKRVVEFGEWLCNDVKEFSSLEWMAALCSHIPDQGEQVLRYYGFYSNVTRDRLKKKK